MKVAFITDTHFGARGDSQEFLNYFFKFFEEVFFPYLEENGITHVVHLGDFLDRRKYVNFNTLQQVRTRIVEYLSERGINLYCIIGNHDTYYRNTNDLNSLVELYERYDNFRVIEKPSVVEFDGLCVGLVPWITKENEKECHDFIKDCRCPILGGHFELYGYEPVRGIRFEAGMNPEMLRNYETVVSGHFHIKQTRDNIQYLGSPYQMTFADLDETKGFHVLDTETREFSFVENPYQMFHSIYYDDTEMSIDDKADFSHLENTFVKVHVTKKTQPILFDSFIDSLYKANVSNLTIVEDMSDESAEEDVSAVDLNKDTMTLISEEIDLLETSNKDTIKKLLYSLYTESLSL